MSQEQGVLEKSDSGTTGKIDATVAFKQMLDIMSNVDPENRPRLIQSLLAFFDLSQPTPAALPNTGHKRGGIPFSEEKILSPKEFLLQKRPQSDVERVTALAYYLTHYRDTPYFKTLDISKLNTEAAQAKFSNAAYAVENASKYGYEGTIGRSYARAFKQLQLMRTLRIRVQPNEPKQSLPVELSGDRAATLRPIPSDKVDDKALPASPPLLQIPPSPKSLPVEPLGERALTTRPDPDPTYI
jgi:hypothetical protein